MIFPKFAFLAAMNDWRPIDLEGLDSDRPPVASFIFTASSYVFTLTDGDEVFEERLEAARIEERCEHLNPAVEADTADLVEELKDLVFAKSSHFAVEKKEKDHLKLKLTGKLFGVDFNWTFRPSSKDRRGNLTFELLKVVARLIGENEHLVKKLKAKDLEIFDLEGSGATLSRKTLKTEPFEEKQLAELVVPKIDDHRLLESIMTRPEYKQVLERIYADLPPTTVTPGCDNKARRKRIRIRGMKKSDLFDDESDDEDQDDDVPVSKKPVVEKAAAAPVPVPKAVASLRAPATQKKNVAKKLKKL
jgi:hypothetical protein